MGGARLKYSSQAAPELLSAMREIARGEGRQFQAVMEEAIQEYIANRSRQAPGSEVMAHFRASVERNRRLMELLADRVLAIRRLGRAIAIQDVLIVEIGGATGMRDAGAPPSALIRPQLGYYYNVIEVAAALLESLANNHSFVDGSK